MDRTSREHRAVRTSYTSAGPWALGFAFLMVGLAAGCQESPTDLDSRVSGDASVASDAATSASAHDGSHTSFPTWHQGFNHGTDGWFGGETAGPNGWCGSIDQQDRRSGDVTPSAGSGYATVEQGPCNVFFAGEFGANLVNGPWAPGDDFSNFSDSWPTAGYVTELDIYLDPKWKANSPPLPSVNFFAPSGTVFTYAVSVRELSSPKAAGVFHYFFVPVLPGSDGLSILGHVVDEAGWYTFRHVLRDAGGELAVDFELAERRGGTLFVEPITTRFYTGLPTADLDPTTLGSGYSWFAAIAHGLELPIDEHRVRPGR